MGGVIQKAGNLAKSIATAPVHVATTLGKLGVEALTLPTTLTTKALASIAPGMFGPLDQKFSQLKGLAKTPFDVADKALTALPTKAIDMIAEHEAKMVDTPLALAGGVLGFKPPFAAH